MLEYASGNYWQSMFQVVIVIRKLYFASFLITIYDNPIINIVMICLFSMGTAVLIWKIKPYKSTGENIKNFIQEFLWTTAVILCIPFSSNLEEQTSNSLGVVIILVLGTLLLLNLVFILYNIKSKYRMIKMQILSILEFMRGVVSHKEEKITRRVRISQARRKKITISLDQ